jgi:hypothetical protein
MDELYRKAGEMYPLKTDGADWDKVMARLQTPTEGSGSPVSAGEHTSNRRWWWLMLLIVPFAWICTRYVHRDAANEAPRAIVAAHPGPGETAGTGAQAPGGQNAGAATAPTAATPAGQNLAGATRAGHGAATQSGALAQNSARQSARAPHTRARDAATGNDQTANALYSARATLPGSTSADREGNRTLENETTPAVANNTTLNLDKAGGAMDFKLPAKPGNPAIERHLASDQTLSTTLHDVAIQKKKNSGFYAGVLGGPDVSTIKWQQLENPGYSLGLLLGYRLNRRLAIEVSALWAHKVYYTDGQYFNTKKADFPPTDTLENLNGNCSMFEIPINLRWDFLYTKSGSFYATAGISSYMMKKEAYTYVAKDVYSWSDNRNYANSGNNFFSIMNLSVGYSLTWKGVGDVRIEPYFKIPLKGVGIGSLPITSTGLYLGLTHSFR